MGSNDSDVPNDEPGMSPLEIWCNEAQERYLLAVAPGRLEEFLTLCRRERCPCAVIGSTTGDGQLQVHDAQFGQRPVDIPVAALLGRPPRMRRVASRRAWAGDGFDATGIGLASLRNQ